MPGASPLPPASGKCDYVQCEREVKGGKRYHLDRPEKQTAVLCTKPGEHQRNGTETQQRNGTRSQLSRRSDGPVVVIAVEKDQALVNRTVNGRKSPDCVTAVEVKQGGTSVRRSSLMTGSDKENCPAPRDRQNARKELRRRRSQDARGSRRRSSRVDEARDCSRERGDGRREGGRELVSGVRGRREEALQPDRKLRRRRHGCEKSHRALKRARAEPAEAVGFGMQSRSRKTSSEVRLSGHVSSPARGEKEGFGEGFRDASNDNACQEEFVRCLRQEGRGGDCNSIGTNLGSTEPRQSTTQADFDCELFTTNEHLPSLDIEAISDSDSEADPMELTIIADPVSSTSEVREGLTMNVPSALSFVPLPQGSELAEKLPQEFISSGPAVGIVADIEPLPLRSPLKETCSGKRVSVSNEEESRDDQSSTGEGSTAMGAIDEDFSLELFPEMTIDLLSPLPPSPEPHDVTIMSPFPYEDITPLPLSQELVTPTSSATPRADSGIHDQEQGVAHYCSTSVLLHSLPSDSLLPRLPFSLPHYSGSSSPHNDGIVAGGGEANSGNEGKTLDVMKVSDGAGHSCRSSKEPSPCVSSPLPPSGPEIEEGELVSEDEDNTSTTSSSVCSKTDADSVPTDPGNRVCEALKASRGSERSCYKKVSAKESTGQSYHRPSSDRTGKRHSRKLPSRNEAVKSHDSCRVVRRSHDPEGYRRHRSHDSNSNRTQRPCDDALRSHDRRRKSHDVEGHGCGSQYHRAPRREVLHSGRDHHRPHAKTSDSSSKMLRKHL